MQPNSCSAEMPNPAQRTGLLRGPINVDRIAATVAGSLLIATVFLIARPYWGIAHDAQLYVAMAVQRQHPDLLANDLFFRAGSQDRFTIFSALFGPLVAWVGADAAALIFTVVGAAIGLGSAWVALRALGGTPESALLGTLLLAAWPGWYGGLRVFSLFEPFATPRIWAIGSILLGLAAALRGRAWLSGIACAAGMALHPLMALPGAVWILVALLRGRPLLMGVIGVAIAAVAALALGLLPFETLVARFDPTWRQLLEDRSQYLLLRSWSGPDLDAVGCSILGAVLVAMRVTGVARRIFAVAAAVGLLGLAATVVGSDWLGSVAVTQIQPWRALWIPTFVAIAGLGLLLGRISAPSREDLIAMGGLASGTLLGVPGGTLVTTVAILLLVGLRAAATPSTRRLLNIGAALLFAQAVIWYVLTRPAEWLAEDTFSTHMRWLSAPVRDGALLSAVGIGAMFAWRRWPARKLHLIWVAAALLGVAVGGVDWWKAYERDVLKHRPIPEAPEILAKLPVSANMYWDADATVPWLAFGRPSYLSEAQTAGIVFSRETAIEAERRSRAVEAVLGPQPFMRRQLSSDDIAGTRPRLDFSGAVRLCADPELGGVYVPAAGEAAAGVAIRNARGAQVGRFVFCSEVRRPS